MDDRPFEFIYNALKLRPHLLNLITNNYLYCLNDPEHTIRTMGNIISDMFKRWKQLCINEDDDNEDTVVKNLAFGISAGTQDLVSYEKWLESNEKTLKNKKNVKDQIVNLFTKEMLTHQHED